MSEPMIVNMRAEWGLLPKVGALVIGFAATAGMVSRIRSHDDFLPLSINSQLDRRASAYISIVKKSKLALQNHETTPDQIRALAQSWVSGAESGKLQAVYPGYCGESLIDGPKGQIFSTCALLVTRLSSMAEAEQATGDPKANDDAILAIATINVVRFGNYETLFTAANYMRRPIKTLESNVSTMTKEQRSRLAKIQKEEDRTEKTKELALVANRLRAQYAARFDEETAKEDDINFNLGKHSGTVAASRFYGFDREANLASSLAK